MVKLLIVEDEKEIREGLAAWVWDSVGIEVTGTCAHGLEALQFISERPVDIVLTDIRMPFMDGIELMEVLYRQYPFIHVVILSGHSDFEYAQRAIQHGAVDYLLKPVQFNQLTHTFEQLILRLREKKQAEHRELVLRRKAAQLTMVLRENFLRRLMQRRVEPDELEQGASEGELLLHSGYFAAAAVRLDRLQGSGISLPEREEKLLAFSLDNIITELWDARELGYHLIEPGGGSFMLIAIHREAAEQFESILEQLVKYTGLFKSTFSLGVGPPVEDAQELHRSARSAQQALARNTDAGVICYSSTELQEGKDFQNSSITVRRPPDSDPARTEPYSGSGETKQDQLTLLQAKQFIQDNYSRSITLKEVADQVYLSQSHLSLLFKERGETYLKFLTSIRMKKATELLVTTHLKIYEIVELVGYSDPAYFAEICKKHTGKTPNELRGKAGSKLGRNSE
ncbi:response regulator [Paenibacillus albus]|uniref:Response regulator n=1 Tax=Paenibacillus albus TaxID=2495582 RepID=A0A3Q8X3F7_9BACL|nr:response regulator [Paenibacillus albus]AZN39305.1 response regulator [Paenibacillus albus]